MSQGSGRRNSPSDGPGNPPTGAAVSAAAPGSSGDAHTGTPAGDAPAETAPAETAPARRRRRGRRRGSRGGRGGARQPQSRPQSGADCAPTADATASGTGQTAGATAPKAGGATGGGRKNGTNRNRQRNRQSAAKAAKSTKSSKSTTAGTGGASATRAQGSSTEGNRKRWLRRVDEYSAGGLVVDLGAAEPCAAIIGRTDRRGRLLWSLPKGHIEAGETAEQAAVREVAEETGINGEILAELGTIDFWFVAEGKRVHKTVRHYLMRATGGELSDADVEVTEVAWVPLAQLRTQLAYPDEQGLVDTADRLLAESA